MQQGVVDVTSRGGVAVQSYSQAVWDAMINDPGSGVAIVTNDGRFEFANDEMKRLLLGDEGPSLEGKTLASLFPQDWVSERLEILRHVGESRRPVLLTSIWRGQRLRSTLHLLPTDNGVKRILVITRAVRSEDDLAAPDARYDVVQSRITDFGPLSMLSRRQLQVLAMIGEGMSTLEMAAALERSPKTIEKHRHAIATKLEIPNRVKLAQIAVAAGLTARPNRE